MLCHMRKEKTPVIPVLKGATPLFKLSKVKPSSPGKDDSMINSWNGCRLNQQGALQEKTKKQRSKIQRNTSFHGNLRGHPKTSPPPRNKVRLSDYSPLVSLNKALLGPYFLGGWHWGSPLIGSHDFYCLITVIVVVTVVAAFGYWSIGTPALIKKTIKQLRFIIPCHSVFCSFPTSDAQSRVRR